MSDPLALPDGLDTATAMAVAPERMEDVISAIPPDKILGLLWWLDELIRRLHAARKGLLIEAEVAIGRGELPSMEVEVAGHRHRFQQDSRNDFDDVPTLLSELARVGIPLQRLHEAVSYVKVTSLRDAIAQLDEDRQPDAYALLDEHRVKRATEWKLVDLDSSFRTSRRKPLTGSRQ